MYSFVINVNQIPQPADASIYTENNSIKLRVSVYKSIETLMASVTRGLLSLKGYVR